MKKYIIFLFLFFIIQCSNNTEKYFDIKDKKKFSKYFLINNIKIQTNKINNKYEKIVKKNEFEKIIVYSLICKDSGQFIRIIIYFLKNKYNAIKLYNHNLNKSKNINYKHKNKECSYFLKSDFAYLTKNNYFAEIIFINKTQTDITKKNISKFKNLINHFFGYKNKN